VFSFIDRITGINESVLGVGGTNARSFRQEQQRLFQGAGQQSFMLKNINLFKKRIEQIKVMMMGEFYTDEMAIRILGSDGVAKVAVINNDSKLFNDADDVLTYDVNVIETAPFGSVKELMLNYITELGKSQILPPQIVGKLLIENSPVPKKEELIRELNQALGEQQNIDAAEAVTKLGQQQFGLKGAVN